MDVERHPALRALDGTRLIFTVTTGRSGTEHLARALAAFPGVKALHEPKPTFSSVFRAVQAHPEVAREFWLEAKLPRIARGAPAVYAETSHLVCKGFLESALELGLRPTLVHLRRPLRAVATSLWRLNTIPGRTLKGVKYYLSPADRGLFLPLDAARAAELEDYQIAYWYGLEIEARAAAYRERFVPLGVEWHVVELSELESVAGLEAVGARLGLPAPGPLGRLQLKALAGKRTNEKAGKKRPFPFEPGELDEREAAVRALATSARAEGPVQQGS